MRETLKASRKRPDSVLEFLRERRKRRNGVGNKEVILSALKRHEKWTPEEGIRMRKAIDDAFERVDE